MSRKKKRARIFPPDIAKVQLSGGEIHYLWWFIQGSIMAPSVRHRLRKAWGFCERHAWAAILVEASFRQGYMHGPAILYEDLLQPALPALGLKGPLKNWRLIVNLNEKGPCMMCDMNLGPETKGAANEALIVRGRNATELRRFAESTRAYWERTICGRCLGNGSWPRCRRHLIQDALEGSVENLSRHRALISDLTKHITLYSRSFRWGFQGTEKEENKAALISAVGWCSGWQPFLTTLGMK